MIAELYKENGKFEHRGKGIFQPESGRLYLSVRTDIKKSDSAKLFSEILKVFSNHGYITSAKCGWLIKKLKKNERLESLRKMSYSRVIRNIQKKQK